MKKQKNVTLKSLNDAQFKVLKRNEMFSFFGGKPPIKTYWEDASYSCGEAVDSLHGGTDSYTPSDAPPPPERTTLSERPCSRC